MKKVVITQLCQLLKKKCVIQKVLWTAKNIIDYIQVYSKFLCTTLTFILYEDSVQQKNHS